MTEEQKLDPLGRIDTEALYQPFLELISQLLANCEARGAIYVATSGERTWEAQDALYAKGRTVEPIGPGHIVTKARGGQSPHNYAIAVDFARHKGATYSGHLDPDYRDSAYNILAEEAEKLGLEAGLHWSGNFQDAPHIQLPIKKFGYTWSHLGDIYRSGGKAALFAELDTHTWGTVAIP